jgi:hypothetical protein
MALTKAEMAERLFDEVGLNKREAKEFVDAFFDALREALEQGRQRSSCRASATSTCAARTSARVATPRPASRSRSPRAPWSPSDRARS